MKKITLTFLITTLLMLIACSSENVITSGMDDEIPAEEQEYIDSILSQITSETTKEEAISLLGEPDRDLELKVNWWVNIASRDSRVGIYFSASTNKATEIVLDGGVGRFYYREKLE